MPHTHWRWWVPSADWFLSHLQEIAFLLAGCFPSGKIISLGQVLSSSGKDWSTRAHVWRMWCVFKSFSLPLYLKVSDTWACIVMQHNLWRSTEIWPLLSKCWNHRMMHWHFGPVRLHINDTMNAVHHNQHNLDVTWFLAKFVSTRRLHDVIHSTAIQFRFVWQCPCFNDSYDAAQECIPFFVVTFQVEVREWTTVSILLLGKVVGGCNVMWSCASEGHLLRYAMPLHGFPSLNCQLLCHTLPVHMKEWRNKLHVTVFDGMSCLLLICCPAPTITNAQTHHATM